MQNGPCIYVEILNNWIIIPDALSTILMLSLVEVELILNMYI